MEASSVASDPVARCKAVTYRTTTLKTTSRKAASIGASVKWMSPAVEPGPRADKDSVREEARTVVAVGRASIRIVGVISVSTGRRTSHTDADANSADSHSDNDRCLRVR